MWGHIESFRPECFPERGIYLGTEMRMAAIEASMVQVSHRSQESVEQKGETHRVSCTGFDIRHNCVGHKYCKP